MIHNPRSYATCPVGVVLTRTPGVTRWAAHAWRATAVLPGAGPAEWRELRRDGARVEFHAATLDLELHGAETEAYVHGLQAQVPCLYVVMRDGAGAHPFDVLLVTASPYEAQDYTDSGEEIVEKVALPATLRAFIEDFVAAHHEEEVFIKRKRDKKRIDLVQDGIGDPRIGGVGDVYASPALKRGRMQ
ncbi:MAG: DUF3305 domain-containing protein [Shimia sp.]